MENTSHPAAAGRCGEASREACDRGGQLVFEGWSRPDGAWQPLGLVADVPDGSRLQREEVSGPVAAITAVRSLEEAVEIVNAGRYGLAAGLHTTQLSDVWTFCQTVQPRMVKVNAPTTGVDYWAPPFGGDKDSSLGPREQRSAAKQFYSTTQTTTLGLLA